MAKVFKSFRRAIYFTIGYFRIFSKICTIRFDFDIFYHVIIPFGLRHIQTIINIGVGITFPLLIKKIIYATLWLGPKAVGGSDQGTQANLAKDAVDLCRVWVILLEKPLQAWGWECD